MSGDAFRIRDATAADAVACAAIYGPYVADTAVSFETDPPSPDEMARRIADASRTHAWLVLENDSSGDSPGSASLGGASPGIASLGGGRVVGYAYGSTYKARAAYRWSCEVSVYLERGRRRTGGGRALYEALFERLAERGFRTVIAGMTLPNNASVGLHTAMGFQTVGTYRRIGWKLGALHDVEMMQRSLADAPDPPAALSS